MALQPVGVDCAMVSWAGPAVRGDQRVQIDFGGVQDTVVGARRGFRRAAHGHKAASVMKPCEDQRTVLWFDDVTTREKNVHSSNVIWPSRQGGQTDGQVRLWSLDG